VKRTPLRRKSPLRNGHGGMKRTTLRSKPRPPEDRVKPEDAAHVFRRDGECIARKITNLGWVPLGHVCRDAFGNVLPVDQTPEMLTIEHVKDTPKMGERAKSDRAHMVAACANANNGDYWCSKYRAYILVYLEAMRRAGTL
jgi:hypothetical protein